MARSSDDADAGGGDGNTGAAGSEAGAAPGAGGTDACPPPYHYGNFGAPLPPADPAEATECSPVANSPSELPDECGCDGMVCDEEQTCVQFLHPARFGNGGPDFPHNACFELCAQNSDCITPAVCVPNAYGLNVCATPECQTDADCTAEPCGNCNPGIVSAHIHDYADPSASYCTYPGSCSDADCPALCRNYESYTDSTVYHRCYSE